MSEAAAWIWSAGDRVRVRWRAPEKPGPHPLVVYLAESGSAQAPDAERARAAWSEFAVVASLDVPLFAERSNPKLVGLAFSGHALGEPLRAYLREQLAADLAAVRAELETRAGIADRAALVACGPAAELLGGADGPAAGFAPVLLEERAPEPERAGQALRDGLSRPGAPARAR